MAKKTWYLLLSLLVCLTFALPYASATEARPDADADEVAYPEADGEPDSKDGETSDPEDGTDPAPQDGEEANPEAAEEAYPDADEVAYLTKAGDIYSENGFTAVERDDHHLRITSYDGTLGDDGILDIPGKIQGIEVREISGLFGNDASLRNTLKEARLPEGLQVLGGVFHNCAALETVRIPSTLETAESPFSGCQNLKNVDFRVGLPRVPATLFYGCAGLISITLPEQMTVVGKNAFTNCSNLETIVFQKDHPYLTQIEDFAFQNCAALKTLELPTGLRTIGNSAFQNCDALKTLELPTGLRTMGDSAFADCDALENLKLATGLRTMGNSAFANCVSLEKVWIPASLERAGSTSPPSPVFANCPKLSGIKRTVENGEEKTEITIQFEETASSIVDYLFATCGGLTEIYIPETIVSIGDNAFYQSGLTSVNIPNSVTSYGANAFRECLDLKEASLSSKAPVISEYMFYDCYALETLSVKPKKPEPDANPDANPDDSDKVISAIGRAAFYECKRLKNLPKWGVLESIGYVAFYRCEELASITLPECLTSLGERAFRRDAMLNKVVIPSALTTIPSYAFANCARLTDISIPKSVKTIEDHAFFQDTDLLRVFIPASVTSISDDEAFSYVDQMIIEGVPGSYAEEWAAQNGAKEFVDESVPVTKISLAGGANSMILPRNGLVAPVFDMYPADNTDVLTLTSSDSSVKVRKAYILYCTNTITEPVTVTATATSGFTFEFTVTCEDMTGLNICYPPEVTDYCVGDTADWSGLVPEAVFKSGAAQPLYNYPSTADTIADKILAWTADELDAESEGDKTVKTSYNGFSTSFSAHVYADADEIPFALRRVERGENGFRLLTNGVAGEARYCAVVAFDADGRFAGVGFKTLSDADVKAGYADFSGVAANAASVKAYLFDDDEAFAPVQFTRLFPVA